MRHFKLPFKVELERKYNEINIDNFLNDWQESQKNRKSRPIMLDNGLHMELGKFKTYDISISEIMDLGLRYALSKQEFRKLAAEVIEIKNKNK
jgi:PHP family Zn ribbon phosphoesterase